MNSTNFPVPLGRDGKYGQLTVDFSRFNLEVQDYIWAYGIRQILNDAIATKVDKDGNDLSTSQLVEKAQAKLDAMYEGTVRMRGEASEPVDPVEQIAYREAKATLEKALRDGGLFKDFPKGTKNRFEFALNRARAASGKPEISEAEAIAQLIAADPSIMTQAKKTYADRQKKANAAADLF